MPWKENCKMDQKEMFIKAMLRSVRRCLLTTRPQLLQGATTPLRTLRKGIASICTPARQKPQRLLLILCCSLRRFFPKLSSGHFPPQKKADDPSALYEHSVSSASSSDIS